MQTRIVETGVPCFSHSNPRVYIASPGFNQEQLDTIREVEQILHECGYDTYSPFRDGITLAPDAPKSHLIQVAKSNQHAIWQSDLMVAIVDDKDTGCFAGDTKIRLLDGRSVAIRDLVGQSCWLYSCTSDGNIVPGRSTGSLLTKSDVPVVRVTLDSGESIFCTPDHPFMLSDGSYKKATDLLPSDSLMALYSDQSNEGYEIIQIPATRQWRYTHRVIAEHINGGSLGKGNVVHHASFDKRNNCPDRLEVMSAAEHWILHSNLASENLRRMWREDEEFRRVATAASARTIREYNTDPKYAGTRREQRLRASVQLKELISALNTDPQYAEYREERSVRMRSRVAEYNKTDRAKKLTSESWKDPEIRARRIAGIQAARSRDHLSPRVRDSHGRFNHRITSVVDAGKSDVYCMQVDPDHNFLLDAGVFVHNTTWEFGGANMLHKPVISFSGRTKRRNVMLSQTVLAHVEDYEELRSVLTVYRPFVEYGRKITMELIRDEEIVRAHLSRTYTFKGETQ